MVRRERALPQPDRKARAFEAAALAASVGIALEERGFLRALNPTAAQLLPFAEEPAEDDGSFTSLSIAALAEGFQDPNGFLAWHQEVSRAGADVGTMQFWTGSGRLLALSASREEGIHEGLIWAIQDQTAHRQTMERLRGDRDGAEAAAEAKAGFLAMASHEIRTPMNAIQGMTDLLLDTPLTRDQRHLLETVRSSCDSLLNILNNTLDLSKIESGTLELRPEPFSLVDLLERLAEGIGPQAFERGLELTCRISADLPEVLEGDHHRIRQVLGNLLGNAIKFTHQGSVFVSADLLENVNDEVRVRFRVMDSGIGIPEEDIHRVFEPFFQVAGHQPHNPDGTGLGLGIVHSLTSLMEGTVEVESAPGRGTTFTVELPLRRSESAFPRQRASDRTYPAAHAILFSRDSQVRESVEEIFSVLEVSCEAAYTPEEVLKGVKSTPEKKKPLVFTDSRIGLEEIRRVGEILIVHAEAPEPVLVLLVPPGSSEGWKIDGLEKTLFVPKPLTRRGVAEALAETEGQGSPSGIRVPGPKARSMGLAGLRLLLVEDQDQNRQYLRRVLEGAEISVVEAEHGGAGVDRYEEDHFDVVLTDLDMPELDGFSLLYRIRDIELHEGRPEAPVIALTAHAVDGVAEQCFAAGMDAYLTKPVNKGMLLRAVRDATRSRRLILVVDDDARNRELACRILTQEGYRVEGLGTGNAAVERVAKGGVDAVLLDMSLPDISGQEVAMRIRNLPPFSEIPLVAVTGHIEPGEEARALSAGCSTFVTKPVKWKGLLETLRILLTRRTARTKKPGGSPARHKAKGGGAPPSDGSGEDPRTGYINATVLREAWARRMRHNLPTREKDPEDGSEQAGNGS